MNKNKRLKILQILQKNNRNNNILLNFNSPFELLIAVLLSCKSTDIAVNKVTFELYKIANTPEKMLSLNINVIKEYIKNIGLFNKKSKYLIEICYILVNKYKGQVPEDYNSLKNLPGVGSKIANVVLNTAFGWPTIAVDTHVFRVCNRTKFALGKNVKQIEQKLQKLVPQKFKKNCHKLLIYHGKNTCTAKHKKCYDCVIKELCEYNSINFS